MQTPCDINLNYVKRVLRYVSGTMDYGILYKSAPRIRLEGYTDVDWAGDASDHRWTSRFMSSPRSETIAWSNTEQLLVALSSTEAKYKGPTIVICEAIWLWRLLQDLRIKVPTPILIYCDNINNMQLAKNPDFHARTKHIEVHYHFVRKRVLSLEVECPYVRTDRHVVDIFTKSPETKNLRFENNILIHIKGIYVALRRKHFRIRFKPLNVKQHIWWSFRCRSEIRHLDQSPLWSNLVSKEVRTPN